MNSLYLISLFGPASKFRDKLFMQIFEVRSRVATGRLIGRRVPRTRVCGLTKQVKSLCRTRTSLDKILRKYTD